LIVVGLAAGVLSGCGHFRAGSSSSEGTTTPASSVAPDSPYAPGRDGAVADPTDVAGLSHAVDEAEQLADDVEQDLASDG
jgi:hypothetical protein